VAGWEAKLIREGKGCPRCEGVRPEGMDLDALAKQRCVSLLDGSDEDPISWNADIDTLICGPVTNEYIRPEDPVLWECAGCHVQVTLDLDYEYEINEPDHEPVLRYANGDKVHHAMGCGPFAYDERVSGADAPATAPHTISGQPYCPGCACHCHSCNESVFCREEVESDEPGASFVSERDFASTLCRSCFDEQHDEDERYFEEVRERLAKQRAEEAEEADA
jgi:hypothetical protein